MKAIIYARVSTEKDSQSASIANQVKACRDYAKKTGLKVVAEFTDEKSGGKFNRPGFSQALAAMGMDEADILIVTDQDRLTRGGAVDIERRRVRDSQSRF